MLNMRKSDSSYPSLHNAFVDTMHDIGLEQVVDFPTRGNNTLDLFLTNHPSLVPRVEGMPGLSDHDVVYLEYATQPSRVVYPKRVVPRYNQADWPGLRSAVSLLSDSIVASYTVSDDAELIWEQLRDGLKSAVSTFVPHKTLGTKRSKPWVDKHTKRLIRRRDRMYKRWRKSADPEAQKELKALKRVIQRRLRRAYWSHTEELISEGVDPKANKKFWSYIKAQKKSLKAWHP